MIFLSLKIFKASLFKTIRISLKHKIMTLETKAIAKTWFDALDKGDMETALGCLDPNIVWINVPKIKDGSEIIPWIGTANGIDEVINQFSTRDGIAEVKEFKPIGMCCEGSTAVGLIRDKTLILDTGITFEIIFATWMTVENNKIIRWKSYCDTAPIIAAFKGIQPPVPQF